MIILKYISLLGILITSSYIGIYKSKEYENRVKELIKLKNAFVMFKTKLEFTYEPIKSIFLDISKIIYKDNTNIFSKVINEKNDIYISWKNAVAEEKSFTNEDKEIISMCGKLLGKTDLKGQVNEINLGLNLLEKQINIAEIEKQKNVKLFRSLGAIVRNCYLHCFNIKIRSF